MKTQWWACFSNGDKDPNWHKLNDAPFDSYNEARQLADHYHWYQPDRQYAIGSLMAGQTSMQPINYPNGADAPVTPTIPSSSDVCKCGHFAGSHTEGIQRGRARICASKDAVWGIRARPNSSTVVERFLIAPEGPCQCTLYDDMAW